MLFWWLLLLHCYNTYVIAISRRRNSSGYQAFFWSGGVSDFCDHHHAALIFYQKWFKMTNNYYTTVWFQCNKLSKLWSNLSVSVTTENLDFLFLRSGEFFLSHYLCIYLRALSLSHNIMHALHSFSLWLSQSKKNPEFSFSKVWSKTKLSYIDI